MDLDAFRLRRELRVERDLLIDVEKRVRVVVSLHLPITEDRYAAFQLRTGVHEVLCLLL